MRLVNLALLALATGLRAAPTETRWEIDGRQAVLRVPDKPAAGHPWLWVAEFPGHLGGFEEAMLARGWHVAHVRRPDQFGSTAAMATWERLHAELVARGLSAKPAILGISRGGLYALAWARRHPERLSALVLDNAVCDARSWPGGRPLGLGEGKGSPGDWARLRQVFGFAGDAAAIAGLAHPTDDLGRARDADVTLISVHGTADTVVPYAENAAHVVAFWQAGGRQPLLFPKQGGDHHPHGLPDMGPVIAALERAAR